MCASVKEDTLGFRARKAKAGGWTAMPLHSPSARQSRVLVSRLEPMMCRHRHTQPAEARQPGNWQAPSASSFPRPSPLASSARRSQLQTRASIECSKSLTCTLARWSVANENSANSRLVHAKSAISTIYVTRSPFGGALAIQTATRCVSAPRRRIEDRLSFWWQT